MQAAGVELNESFCSFIPGKIRVIAEGVKWGKVENMSAGFVHDNIVWSKYVFKNDKLKFHPGLCTKLEFN